MTNYPEHERLKEIRGHSRAIGDFIEWLGERKMPICKLHTGPDFLSDGEYFPYQDSTDAILAEYFEIDLKRLEDEKQAMIDALRAPAKEA